MAVSFNPSLPRSPTLTVWPEQLDFLMQKNFSHGPPHTSSHPRMPREGWVLLGLQVCVTPSILQAEPVLAYDANLNLRDILFYFSNHHHLH